MLATPGATALSAQAGRLAPAVLGALLARQAPRIETTPADPVPAACTAAAANRAAGATANGLAALAPPRRSPSWRQQQQQQQPHGPAAAGQRYTTLVRCSVVPPVNGAHHLPPPRTLPLVSTHGARCLTIGLAVEMAMESGAVIDRSEVQAAHRPFRTGGWVESSQATAMRSRDALGELAARLSEAASG